MRKLLCLFFAVTAAVLCSCSHKPKQAIETENGSKSPVADDTKYEAAMSVEYLYFEDLMEYVTDVVEAKYIGSEATVDPLTFYLKFEIIKNIRGNGVDGTVYVQITPADYYVKEKNISFSTSDYNELYDSNLTYLLLLTRWSSVYDENDTFSFVSDSLILPIEGVENPDSQAYRTTMYGTDLTDHFREEETLLSFKNGRLEKYILEEIENNPFFNGYDYIKSTDPAEVIQQSEFIFLIRVDEKQLESYDGSRATYHCSIEEALRGNAGSQRITVTFLSGTVETGGSYVVALSKTDGETYFILSSKKSLFNVSDIDWIKDLTG